MPKGKKRGVQEINASSMADIAFLLLIFFLVTTTVNVDKGILIKLPRWTEEPPPPPDKNYKRNTMVVLINAKDQLLVNDKPAQVEDLRAKAKEFINNRGRNPDLSDSPKIAVISLQNDRGTSYGIYLAVQNELKAAYRELRDDYAMQKFGKTYNELREESQTDNSAQEKMDQVQEEYPLRLSEAEPKAIGGE